MKLWISAMIPLMLTAGGFFYSRCTKGKLTLSLVTKLELMSSEHQFHRSALCPSMLINLSDELLLLSALTLSLIDGVTLAQNTHPVSGSLMQAYGADGEADVGDEDDFFFLSA